ncbi:ATP-grasp fold amidoligase family protein [Glutamicibacter sp.]|uniref:ATP-grasp fold amidoligase family protein n=1 Tax=Glutamicibacter sp. TaxID=1931995 RepID=UPI0028BEF87F|nr:ATP-grasp fold amidoligase family protein [Glutamicibacter sp.]
MSKSRSYPQFVKNVVRKLPDTVYLQLRYFSKFKTFYSMRHPRTYNEKLQWLKVNYRVRDEPLLVDKYEVKSIVARKIGNEYVIPTLGIYNSVDEIDFDSLPSSFVLKCTHDSGGVVLVQDKNDADIEKVRARLAKSMHRNYFYSGREPHYLQIKPRIIAEPYFADDRSGQLLDYKFFCFDGQVKAMFVASDRASGNVKFDYFDPQFEPLELKQPYPNSAVLPSKPTQFNKMIELSRILSEGHPHVRVDLYEVNGKVFFGELTFFHFSGMEPFKPEKWDRLWGDWLTLPAAIKSY